VLAKNEARNIKKCIYSQIGCIDEIIVLIDDTSTDETEEIVKSIPHIRYFKIKWEGYAETKKKGVQIAENNWILWIDADEALTAPLREEIKLFKEEEPQYDTYSFPRKSFFIGKWIKHSGWYPGMVTRLFNKNFTDFSSNYVHEHLVNNGKTGSFKNDIEHYTDPSITHYFNKFNIYTSLAAEDLSQSGKNFKMSDITIRPFFLFIKMYIIKRGFLDGLEGFMIAIFSSAYVFTKYCKLWEINKGVLKNGSK
jgi:glycosyltransferase involved in cell wall biosynthesis